MSLLQAKHEKSIYLLLGILLLVYLCLRAFYVPLVHDEAATFFYYIHPNNFIPPLAHSDANNHILNSALASLTYDLLGNSELVLRLPNLLFAVVYLYFCYRIATLLKHTIIRWSFILTMLGAHYFIEFFAYCRGYGMSMALILSALWFLIAYMRNNKTKYLITVLLLLLLAVLANLTLLISGMIVMAYLLVQQLFFKASYKKKALHVLLIIIIGIAPSFILTKLLFFMKESGMLYYGESTGFIDATVNSLIKAFTGFSGIITVYFIGVLFIIMLFLLFLNFWKHKFPEVIKSVPLIFIILIIGNAVAAILLNKFFGVNFPEDRVGLYYFPFFSCAFYFILDDALLLNAKKYILSLCIPFFFFPLHFLTEMNISHAGFWKDDQVPLKFYQKVTSSSGKYFKKLPPIVSGYRLWHLDWYYYNYRDGGNKSILNMDDYPCRDADFVIAPRHLIPGLLKDYDSAGFYKPSNLYLLERKHNLTKEIIDSVTNVHTPGIINDEYFSIWGMNARSLINRSVYIGFNFTFNSPAKPFESRIVVSTNDKEKNILQYQYIQLDWLKKQWKGEKDNLMNNILVYHLPENADTLAVYFWNIRRKDFSISNGKCFVYGLK
jgi:hypothetical protein